MIWVGGAQGAGKTTWSWQLSRAHDLPLHAVDLWAYDHQARLPASDSLDDQLARGPEAAADAFESVSRLRLELVLDDIRARDLGTAPAIVEGPQLMPGFAGELPAGWGVWLVPDPGRTRLAREERLAKAESLGGRTVAAGARVHRLLERDAVIAGRVRASALLSGRPVIEVPAVPDWPAIAAAASSAVAPALRVCASSGAGPGAKPAAPVREQGSRPAGQAVDGRRRAHCGAFLSVRVRVRDERVPRYLDGHARRLRGQDR